MLARGLAFPRVKDDSFSENQRVEPRPRSLPAPALLRARGLGLQPDRCKLRRERLLARRTACRCISAETAPTCARRKKPLNLAGQWRHQVRHAGEPFLCRPQPQDRGNTTGVAVGVGRFVESVVNDLDRGRTPRSVRNIPSRPRASSSSSSGYRPGVQRPGSERERGPGPPATPLLAGASTDTVRLR